MPPQEEDTFSDFECLICDGETFQNKSLGDIVGEKGTILVFFGFAFSAISENWWRRLDRENWDELDGIKVVGITRDGPYALNEFIRYLDSPFTMISDIDGNIINDMGLLTTRPHMNNVSTSKRALFLIDNENIITYSWIGDDWISPIPIDDVKEKVGYL